MSGRSDCRAAEFWSALFGRDVPVEIEIGSGDGTFLAAFAARHRDRGFLGIERSPSKFRRLEARLARIGAPNVRVLRADATCVVPALIPAASVAAYHVYFPDPWPKRGHAFRRIFSERFIAALAETLVADGRVHLTTDVPEYAACIRADMLAHRAFAVDASAAEPPGLQTAFARKYRAAGRTLYATTFVRAACARPAAQPAAAASKIKSM